MALALNLVAVPVLAALAAGTGAVATFVNGSAATLPVAAAAQADQPCATQTWPYIDSKCTTGQAKPKVRMVMAPRSNETPGDVIGSPNVVPAAVVPPAAAPEAAPNFTSRDTVLRQPDVLAPPKVSKSRDKRSEQRRRERRLVTQSYQVPAEFDRRSRAVLVVRPMRLDGFR
jgi:hypothetical protein